MNIFHYDIGKLERIIGFLDSIYCFSLKTKAKCTYSFIRSVATNLGLVDLDVDMLFKFVQWLSLNCSDMFSWKSKVSMSDSMESYELSILKDRGLTDKDISKRKQTVMKALIDFIIVKYQKNGCSGNIALKSSTIIKSGWPHGFPLQQLEAECFQMIVFSTLSTSNCSDEADHKSFKSRNINLESESWIDEFKNLLLGQDFYQDQLVGSFSIPPKEAVFDRSPLPISDIIKETIFDVCKISAFFVHQSKGIKAIFNGKHVGISTSTSSGKSLIYNSTVLDYLYRFSDSSAMYIFPTKV